MIGRRGFLQLIGAAVLGLSISLRGEQHAQASTFDGFEPDPAEVTDLQVWGICSKDGGRTWFDINENYQLSDGEIVRWPSTHKRGWSMTTQVRNG